MAKIYLIKYELNGTTIKYRYELGNLKRYNYDVNTPVAPMPLPEEDSSENVLIKIEGNSSAMTISWTIKDEDIDREDVGTVSGTTKTIRDQIFFFEDKFVPTSVDDSFSILLDFDGTKAESDNNLSYKGTFTQFHADMVDPQLLTFNGRIKFLQGSVALLFEVDAVSEPLNLVATSPVAGRINADWDTPLDAGSSAITDYRVFYRIRNSGSAFSTADVGGTATILSPVATGLATGTYEIFVRGKSLIGFGRPSTTKVITVA